MANNFSLLITGLCAFVPKYKIEPSPETGATSALNQMRVLLVDSSHPPDLPHSHGLHSLEPHLPVLACRYDDVIRDGYRTEDATYIAPEDDDYAGTRMAVFYLDDQDLSILDTKPCSLEVEHAPVKGCPDELNLESFEWVAPLKKISPGSEAIRDSCFAPAYKGVDPAVITRVRLTEGTIRTGRLAMDGARASADRRIVEWKFKVPGQGTREKHRQAIADVVKYDLPFMTDYVTLMTSLFRPTMNQRVEKVFERYRDLTIHLKPDDKGQVTAWIKNMPWTDITGTRPANYGPREPDLHFAHFYKLSYAYDEANVPHPYRRCPPPRDERHKGNPNCPPPQTAPNELA